MSISRFIAIVVTVVICGPVCIQAQQDKVKWQRVYTGEGLITEVDPSSLVFAPNRILQARFRTIVSEPIPLKGSSGPEYKSALQTIAFKLTERRYRLAETVYLDSKGNVLETATSEDWRELKERGIMDGIFSSLRTLPPLGSWRVIAYRSAETMPDAVNRRLERMVGKRVRLDAVRAEVGANACNSVAFEDRRYTKDEFAQKLGFELKAIGVNTEHADTIDVNCAGGWQPSRSMLIKVSDDDLLMLWDGVFLVLKR